ncbi:MAG: NAD(P)-dependent alcohol dehydrogenase [Candidatus Omnitrophica bacterium]|nr:NAD(P)-dependent alcohol dehydrogenase [Candidatus Omnitrophota bacterium]MCB9768058.1 NAD(P)-dependent alcohol dehydrogenase [Candidatus Omnitrophota bacterium]
MKEHLMRIWRFHEFGPIENLQLDEVPTPEPGADESLVELEYAALNPADKFLVNKMYPRPGKPPMAVGRDGSGRIVKPGNSGRFKEGDSVVILRSDIGVRRDGTLAEFVTVPEESLAPLPDGWSFEEGAAAPLVHLTAWRALVHQGEIHPGQTVLVTGSSGGVGTAAIQLAKAFGCRVFAMSRKEEKRKELLDLGADHALDSSDPGKMEEEAKAILGEERVHLVVENLGGPFLQTSINLSGEHGRILVIGLLAGLKSEIVLGQIIFKQTRIEGVQVGAWTAEEAQIAWAGIVEKLDASNQRPVIDQVFPFEEVQEAFTRLDEGPLGKVLVRVKD